MEARVGELRALHAAPDGRAAEPVLLHALLELLGGELRMLERDGGEGHEAVGMRSAGLGQRLVLHADELLGHVAVRPVPEGVDAERFHVDALRVHGAEAIRRRGHQERVGGERQAHQGHRLGEPAVRVHVHRLHALAAHHHLTAPPRGGRAPDAARAAGAAIHERDHAVLLSTGR
jgi:hypothetical protein